jgi:HTH-type transcriptional regulator/antitoxin MqsA
MKNISMCSICEEGNFQTHIGSNIVEYKDHKKELDMHYSECDCCGSETATPAQLRTNKRLMTEFKKQIDGLLTGQELKKLRLELGLTQADAANIFGGGPVAFSKYEADDVAQSEAMDKLLRVAQAVPEAYSFLTNKSYANEDVNSEKVNKQCCWEILSQDAITLSLPKSQPLLRVISSTNLGQGEDYGQLQAVG